jgi:hypothetical protein
MWMGSLYQGEHHGDTTHAFIFMLYFRAFLGPQKPRLGTAVVCQSLKLGLSQFSMSSRNPLQDFAL